MTEGALKVRAAEEPLPLARPTTVTGRHDTGDDGTGAVAGLDLSTPPISFQTEASGIVVYIDASFSSVTPASGTGAIDSGGNVSLRTDLKVDLDLRLNSPSAAPIRCSTAPVSLGLDSTDPYDAETQTVTVRDTDFSIPPVQVTSACHSAISGAVNESLAGAGNSLDLTLAGALTLPPAPGCPSVTTLTAVTPATSFEGQGVSISAQVVPDPAGAGTEECQDAAGAAPTGLVDFRAGGEMLGSAELDGTGAAQASFTDLPLGEQTITARYRGDAAYSPSTTSSAATHTVYDRPSLVSGLPPTVVIGAEPVEFDVTLTNPEMGGHLANARIDATLVNYLGQPIPPNRVVLERPEGAGWVRVNGSLGVGPAQAADGAPVLVGGEAVQRLRISVPSGAPSQRVTATFEVVVVDPATGLPSPRPAPAPDALASAGTTTLLAADGRIEPAVPNPLYLSAPMVRQGMTVSGVVTFAGPSFTDPPTGSFRVLFDGAPVPIGSGQPEEGYHASRELFQGVASFKFEVPPNVAPGQHEVTVLYGGDDLYEPASASGIVTVAPPRGTLYECRTGYLVFIEHVNVYVSASGTVPSAAPAGTEVDVRRLDIRIFADRGFAADYFGQWFEPHVPVVPSGEDGFNVVDLRFGGASGTATAVTFHNNLGMWDPADTDPDMVIGFDGESATIPVAGEPGDVVPVTLDSFKLTARVMDGFANPDLSCEARGEPVSLGAITVAGTTLSVETTGPAREGDAVTLRARVAPAGVAGRVEFRDGTRSLGSVAVAADGTASMVTRRLAVGPHELSAVFRGGSLVLPSAPVALRVRPERDCPSFLDEGHGAVVRLVYLELLGRCPDRAGFDFWVGRLSGGTTPEVFARSIAGTPEAVGRVVDDAYETMLGRPADTSGREFWTGRLSAHGRYDALLADLGASEEFWARAGGTNEGFVTRTYAQLMGRSPDQAGQDHWVGRLDGGTSRRALIVSLATLDEPLGVLVADSYDEILSRRPTSAERSDGVTFLRRTGDRSGLYAQLIGRPEFSTRAQSFPNPED